MSKLVVACVAPVWDKRREEGRAAYYASRPSLVLSLGAEKGTRKGAFMRQER